MDDLNNIYQMFSNILESVKKRKIFLLEFSIMVNPKLFIVYQILCQLNMLHLNQNPVPKCHNNYIHIFIKRFFLSALLVIR